MSVWCQEMRILFPLIICAQGRCQFFRVTAAEMRIDRQFFGLGKWFDRQARTIAVL